MRYGFPLFCLLSMAGGALPLQADIAAALEQTVVVNGDTLEEAHLRSLLDAMLCTSDSDFFAASTYMMESTGDELAFVQAMRKFAGQGHVVAMYWMATRGNVSAEEKIAYLRASSAEYPPALVPLACMVYTGWGDTPADRNTAKDVLMSACKLGSAEARALYIKWGYLDGKEVDCTQAEIASELKRHNYRLEEHLARHPGLHRDWMKEASDHGSPWAAFEKFRLESKTNKDEAFGYLRLSAERHYPPAMQQLGCMLFSQSPHGGADAVTGITLLRQAASTGEDPRAVALSALAYANFVVGQGECLDAQPCSVEQHVAALFRYAHEQGDALGTAGLGYCMVLGSGCQQDVEQGVSLLLQAEKSLPCFADLALYHIYADGQGVPADAEKAAMYQGRFADSSSVLPSVWVFISKDVKAPFLPALEVD